MKRLFAVLMALLLFSGVAVAAYKISDGAAYYPAAYTFTASEMAELREMIADGKGAEALALIDGRMDGSEVTFILNPRTGKYHMPWCKEIAKMTYPVAVTGDLAEMQRGEFRGCKKCDPSTWGK